MGLPEIIIEFKTKGVTAIKRSARGIVAIVLKDDTEEGQANTGSKVFITSNVKFVDAMEDLKLTCNM